MDERIPVKINIPITSIGWCVCGVSFVGSKAEDDVILLIIIVMFIGYNFSERTTDNPRSSF